MNEQTHIANVSEPIDVGGISLRNRAFLAPMSGVTDAVFRNLAWKHGAGLVVSEMIASQSAIEGDNEMHLKMQHADIPVHMVQLVGREAKWMALAAKMVEANGATIIDINMGCPAKRVTTGYSGSALMRDLDHALSLIDSVVSAVEVPVTLKMRLGWDDQSINAPELAKRAEDAGVKMITVHGRTRCQFYKGTADWKKVASVKAAITIPLVVNGDILDRDGAEKALSESGADAVMIGRASYGAPWLPGHIAAGKQTLSFEANLREIVCEHYQGMLSLYGREGAIRRARKHLAWYMDHSKTSHITADERRKILTGWNPDEVLKLLDRVFQQPENIGHLSFAAAVAA